MKARFRIAAFWAHLAVGVVAAVFIVNMAASGILLAYESNSIRWSERTQTRVRVPPGQARLDVEMLIAAARRARPAAGFYRMVHHSDPAACEAFFDTGERSQVLYLNPYTAAVAGDGQQGIRRFFHAVTGWHRWLSLAGKNKPIGKTITGTVSLVFLGLLLSGLFLWVPKTWSRKTLGRIALFRCGLTGKARDWNWHNVVGLSCAPLLLILTLTGILMSFAWAQHLLNLAAGDPPPVPPVPRVQAPPPKPKAPAAKPAADLPPLPNTAGLNALLASAETKMPGWKTINLVLPNSPAAPVAFFLSGAGEGDTRPDLSARLVLARPTGAVVEWDPSADHPAGSRIQEWMAPIHTGEAGGLAGQCLAVVAAAGAILLSWTGLALAWRRFFGARRSSGESAAALPGPGGATLRGILSERDQS